MKALIFILRKYWRKNLKSAFAFIFSGALLTAIVFTVLMTAREQCVRYYHTKFDMVGHFDFLIANSNDELLAKATEGKDNYDYGVINVLGEMGYAENRFVYGTLSDEHNVWHIPLAEGRMPETENEIAATGNVLDAFFWAGKCGGTITLDGKVYTVTGIIDNEYAVQRPVYDPFSRIKSAPKLRNSPYKIPLIFVGKSDEAPLYRIDLIGNFFAPHITGEEIGEFRDYLFEFMDNIDYSDTSGDNWFDIRWDDEFYDYSRGHTESARFLMTISWIGAAISALSVYSVLRMIFLKRRGRIEILKRIGMSKRRIIHMYALEGAGFAVIQTLIGLLAGLAAYGVIWLVKTGALGEKPYSAFTDLWMVLEKTSNPVLFACLVSFAVVAAAYLINVLTARSKLKAPGKKAKPRSLNNCFANSFRQTKVTAVQLISLTLICYSAIMGYMFYTNNGKETTLGVVHYVRPLTEFNANGFNMEKNNIAEYYSCTSPRVHALGNMYNQPIQFFPFISGDFSGGFDDELAAQMPEGSFITGKLEQTFIASDKSYGYFDDIDLRHENVREIFLLASDEKYANFFDEGELGSKFMYRIYTKLAPPNAINSLAESGAEGSVDIDALNRGEEIVLVYKSRKPPFEVGEYITVYSATAMESGTGISELLSADVKIAAIIQLPGDIGEIEHYTVFGKEKCNFLTTAAGAQAMGFPGAVYTELYSPEEIDGGIFPSSAKMRLENLAQMKRSHVLEEIARYSGVTLILVLVSMLGFSGYFNGIGLKISQKKYEVSIFRALGLQMLDIKKRIVLDSVKIPFAASVFSYGLVRITQHIMELAYKHLTFLNESDLEEQYRALARPYRNTLFLDNVMWQVNAEIPSLILFVVLCAVTLILTAAALKKFKGSISEDMNDGRTRE